MGAHTSLLGGESWSWIWRLCVPLNIQFFLWKLCHDSVPFRSVLLSRNHISSNLCPICNKGSEDMLHALFSGPRAKDMWSFCLHKSVTPPDRDNLQESFPKRSGEVYLSKQSNSFVHSFKV